MERTFIIETKDYAAHARFAERKRERLLVELNTLENHLEHGCGTRWLIVEQLNRIEQEVDEIDDFLGRSQQELAS